MLQFKNKIEISCKEFAGIQKCNLDKPICANSDVKSVQNLHTNARLIWSIFLMRMVCKLLSRAAWKMALESYLHTKEHQKRDDRIFTIPKAFFAMGLNLSKANVNHRKLYFADFVGLSEERTFGLDLTRALYSFIIWKVGLRLRLQI